MAKSEATTAGAVLTRAEREYLRRELDVFFSTLPTVVEGFMLRTWRGGPHKGAPKLPPAAKSLLDRGLAHLDASGPLPRLFLTEGGVVALRRMMADSRLANPQKFAHVRRELGIGPDAVMRDGRRCRRQPTPRIQTRRMTIARVCHNDWMARPTVWRHHFASVRCMGWFAGLSRARAFCRTSW